MKKTIKKILLVALSLLMCFVSIPVHAAEVNNQIMPRLSHVGEASFVFDATSSGGIIEATYTANPATFVSAKLTVKVEDRFLWVFWSEVGTWTATCTDIDGIFSHVMPLNAAGTYRATFTLEVTGTDGTVDVVDTVIESSY